MPDLLRRLRFTAWRRVLWPWRRRMLFTRCVPNSDALETEELVVVYVVLRAVFHAVAALAELVLMLPLVPVALVLRVVGVLPWPLDLRAGSRFLGMVLAPSFDAATRLRGSLLTHLRQGSSLQDPVVASWLAAVNTCWAGTREGGPALPVH